MATEFPNQADIILCLEKMITGDQVAFEQILLIFEKPIFNHLLRLTKNSHDASDLLQETFIKVYSNRSQIDTTNNFKNWIYKIATNVAYDFFRKKKRENLVSIDDEALSETIAPELSYDRLESEITVIDLENSLREIQPHYKNVLLLYYREGFSYEELSVITELPLNTIKTHLRRARQELRELLKNTYG